MNKSFSHLIWLGAGQAKEPAGLIDQAKQVTLVDARESACAYLKKHFPSDHVQIATKLITIHEGQHNFTEYNLPEYSALQEATGLKNLFPGLKIAHQETMDSVSLEEFFKELHLTENKNLLVLDLPDINQAFLEALHKTGYLYKFNKLYIFSNPAPLYLDAANTSVVVNFLQSVGYWLQKTISTDPDFPCLVFGINPLWIELQQENYLNTKLVSDTKELQTQQEILKQQLIEAKKQTDMVLQERESLKQQLTAQQQQKDSQDKERETLKLLLIESKQQADAITKETESLKQQTDLLIKERESLNQQFAAQQQQKNEQDKEQEKIKQKLSEEHKKLTDLNDLLDQVTKQSTSRKDAVGKLEKEKRQLEDINKNLKLKQNLLEKELIKAEAQIELIKMLLVKS